MYSFASAAAWEILVTVCAVGKEQTLKQVQKKRYKGTQPDAPHTKSVIIHSILRQEKPLKDQDQYFVASVSKIN
jgi:hypothetical protein